MTGSEPESQALSAGTAGGSRFPADRMPLLSAAAVVLVLAGLAVLLFSLFGNNRRPLYPNLPTFTPAPGNIESEPLPISFTDLNANPAAYQGRRLQVSGAYTPVERPGCLPFNGPPIRWSLVADELQLNALGFEQVLGLVEPGTQMTVTGIWRVYQGPVGCGKEPAAGTVWYLQADRIVEPNPLSGATGPALTVIPGAPPGTLTFDEPDPTATPSPTIENAEIATPTLSSPESFPPLAPTQDAGLPTATTTATPTATVATPEAGATPELSPTPGPSPTPSPTGNTQLTGTPPMPTATPPDSGYPPPTSTSESGYP